MNKNLQLIIFALVLLAVGIFVGRLIGVAETYKKTSGLATRQYYRGVAADLTAHRQLLELYQANQKEKLGQKLENLIDAELRALDRYSNVPVKDRNPEVVELIQRAKEYQQKPPAGPPGS